MKKIIIIIFIFSLIGCEVSKKATKDKIDRDLTETIKTTTYRKGDTITIEVPNVIYKDTVIEKVNYENKTIARITYDDKGNAQFDCIESQLKETTEINRRLLEVIKTKDSEKEKSVDNTALLITGGVFIVFFIIFMVVIVFALKKYLAPLTSILPKNN